MPGVERGGAGVPRPLGINVLGENILEEEAPGPKKEERSDGGPKVAERSPDRVDMELPRPPRTVSPSSGVISDGGRIVSSSSAAFSAADCRGMGAAASSCMLRFRFEALPFFSLAVLLGSTDLMSVKMLSASHGPPLSPSP